MGPATAASSVVGKSSARKGHDSIRTGSDARSRVSTSAVLVSSAFPDSGVRESSVVMTMLQVKQSGTLTGGQNPHLRGQEGVDHDSQ